MGHSWLNLRRAQIHGWSIYDSNRYGKISSCFLGICSKSTGLQVSTLSVNCMITSFDPLRLLTRDLHCTTKRVRPLPVVSVRLAYSYTIIVRLTHSYAMGVKLTHSYKCEAHFLYHCETHSQVMDVRLTRIYITNEGPIGVVTCYYFFTVSFRVFFLCLYSRAATIQGQCLFH